MKNLKRPRTKKPRMDYGHLNENVEMNHIPRIPYPGASYRTYKKLHPRLKNGIYLLRILTDRFDPKDLSDLSYEIMVLMTKDRDETGFCFEFNDIQNYVCPFGDAEATPWGLQWKGLWKGKQSLYWVSWIGSKEDRPEYFL